MPGGTFTCTRTHAHVRTRIHVCTDARVCACMPHASVRSEEQGSESTVPWFAPFVVGCPGAVYSGNVAAALADTTKLAATQLVCNSRATAHPTPQPIEHSPLALAPRLQTTDHRP